MFRNISILICFFYLVLTGCVSKIPEVSPVSPSPALKAPAPTAYKVNHPFSKVVGASNKISVVNVLTSTVDAKLFVQIELLNDRGRRDVLDYRIRWLDSYGMQVVEYEPWVAVSLEGKESSILTFRAPRATAVDFRFEFKNHY